VFSVLITPLFVACYPIVNSLDGFHSSQLIITLHICFIFNCRYCASG